MKKEAILKLQKEVKRLRRQIRRLKQEREDHVCHETYSSSGGTWIPGGI